MSKISRAHLQPVIQRIDKRLPGWIPRLLGSGGRVQMINSVLSAIPNFFMACILWDKATVEAINKITRAFLWKNKTEIHGGHCLVAWETVILPKEQGGLGIRNLLRHNQALMANLAAKLLSDGTGPCFDWLSRWYLQGQIPNEPHSQDTPFWKSLLKAISIVQGTTRCIVKSGKSIAFWIDNWTELGRLNEAFPILYSYAKNETCTVKSQFTGNGWEPELHESLSATAQLQLQALLAYLQNNHPQLSEDPDARLLVTTGKSPTTKGYYSLLCDHGMRWLPKNWVWTATVPHRHKIFLWLAFRDRLNTNGNMTKKKWRQDAGCDLCPAIESIHHITLHCKYSNWVWDKWMLSEAASQATSITHFVQHIQSTKDGITAQAWPICFAAGMLNLWKMRNDRIFNQKHTTRRMLRWSVANDIELWANRSPKLQDELRTWAAKMQTL
jgi:hypothetical protein